MKKINNEGFVLMETLVVSVFVIVAFLIVYRNGLPLIQEYSKLENYDDVDSLYAANLIKEILMSDDNKTQIFQCFNNPSGNINVEGVTSIPCGGSSSYVDLTGCNMFKSENRNKCIKAIDYADIDSIILTKRNPSFIKKDIDNKVFSQNILGFASYVNFLNSKYVDDSSQNGYMIIVGRVIITKNGYIDNNNNIKYEDISVLKFGSIGVDNNG